MLIVLILVLLLVGSAVIGSIYSNFLVFYSNFRETEDYHKAYYASISALERGELVTKQHEPGYVGSGGFILGTGQGSVSPTWTGGSDGSLSGFSYFGTNSGESTVFWTVNSRTKRIPAIGEGDVEEMFVTGDVKDYNMMDYENAEVFLLSYDKEKYPYSGGNVVKSNNKYISGVIRLPSAISGRFGSLDTDKSVVGNDGSLPPDDAIVDRQIRGQYNGNGFIIYSTPAINYNTFKVIGENDSVFRESDVNTPLEFYFGDNKNSIKNPSRRGIYIDKHTVISQSEDVIKGINFKDIFSLNSIPSFSPYFTGLQLRFSLLNILESKKVNGKSHTYPFLEYYADFGTGVADKYYHINAEGNYKDYQINLIIHKPTVKETVLGSFTTIF